MRLPLRRILPVLTVWAFIVGVWIVASITDRPYQFGRKKPFWKGKVVLDKIWQDAEKIDTIWVSGRFIGPNPVEKLRLASQIRESPDGAENDLTNLCVYDSDKKERNEYAFRFEFKNAPVASPMLYMRIYGWPKGEQNPPLCALVDFAFPNPHRRHVEPWEAEPIPATRINGPVTVELINLECGPAVWQKGSGYRRSSTGVRVRVFENGGLSARWRPMWVQYSSGLGVTCKDQGAFQAPYGESVSVLHNTLWKSQAPWKIHMILMRARDLLPGEIIEIRDIPVPGYKQTIPFDQKWRVSDQEIQFVGIANSMDRPGSMMVLRSSVFLHFRTPDPMSCCVKLLSVADAQGKVIWEPRDEYWRGTGSDGRDLFFALPDRLQVNGKISCKLGVVWEKREVEFVVNPTYVGTPYLPKVEPLPKAAH